MCQVLLYRITGHAPRERVSWNAPVCLFNSQALVTLHVSVWVEIMYRGIAFFRYNVTLHVSVWVEIMFFTSFVLDLLVTLHVSVWVEMHPQQPMLQQAWVTLHVSVWVEIM